MVKRRQKKKNRSLWGILIPALLIVLGILAFLFRDELFGRPIPTAQDGVTPQEPYTFENGANQQFALSNGRLAISSSTGLQILDEDGYPLERQVFSMKNPALSVSDRLCAFYDVGGTALKVFADGETRDMDTDESIISVSVNKNGYMAVAAEDTGYKGSVTVYDPSGVAAYKWYSGTGYVLDAAVSPDNSRLVVLCVGTTGSVAHIFTIGEEDEEASVSLPYELAFRVSFAGDNRICLLSESSLSFFSVSGEQLEYNSFEGSYLIDYLMTDELRVVALSKYVSGSGASLMSYGDSGSLLGAAQLDFPPLCLSSLGSRLIALGSGEVSLFSGDMSLVSETEVPAGYASAVLMSGSRTLLLSSYHGEVVSIR